MKKVRIMSLIVVAVVAGWVVMMGIPRPSSWSSDGNAPPVMEEAGHLKNEISTSDSKHQGAKKQSHATPVKSKDAVKKRTRYSILESIWPQAIMDGLFMPATNTANQEAVVSHNGLTADRSLASRNQAANSFQSQADSKDTEAASSRDDVLDKKALVDLLASGVSGGASDASSGKGRSQAVQPKRISNADLNKLQGVIQKMNEVVNNPGKQANMKTNPTQKAILELGQLGQQGFTRRYDQGDIEQKMSQFSNQVKNSNQFSDETQAILHHQIGDAFMVMKKPSLAEKNYTHSIQKSSGPSDTLLKRAQARQKQQKWKPALADLEQVASMQPSNAQVSRLKREVIHSQMQAKQVSSDSSDRKTTPFLEDDDDETRFFSKKIKRDSKSHSNQYKSLKRQKKFRFRPSFSFSGVWKRVKQKTVSPLSNKSSRQSSYTVSSKKNSAESGGAQYIWVWIMILFVGVLVYLILREPSRPSPKKETPKLIIEDDAIQKISQEILKSPNDYLLFKKRAELYEKKKGFEQALEDYHSVLRLRPNNIIVMKRVVNLYVGLKQFESAEQFVEKVIKLNGEDIIAHKYAAIIYDEKSDEAKTVESFRKINDLIGKYKNIYTEKDIVSIDINRYVELRHRLSQTSTPDQYELIKGQIKHVIGDWKAAIEHLTESIKMNSKNKDAYYYRGLSRKKLGDLTGSQKDLENA